MGTSCGRIQDSGRGNSLEFDPFQMAKGLPGLWKTDELWKDPVWNRPRSSWSKEGSPGRFVNTPKLGMILQFSIIKIKYKIKIERYCDFCERELKSSNKSNFCDKTCEHNYNYDKELHDPSIQKDDGERSSIPFLKPGLLILIIIIIIYLLKE